MTTFYSNYSYLCMQNGESVNSVAAKIKISSGSVSNWKKGQIPTSRLLSKVADYFGVSPEELLSVNMNVHDSFSEDEIKLIKLFRALNSDGQKRALQDLADLAEISRYTEDTLSKAI